MASGGTISTGGTIGPGGSSALSGGSSALGGGSSSGVTGAGGTTNLGGGAAHSGSPSSGGNVVATGGTSASGGTATGGANVAGGNAGTGGAIGGGGGTGTGGKTATGGVSGVGGSVGGGGAAGAASGGGTGSTFHVFLLLGQSNMAGYSKALDVDKVKNPRIKVLGFDACSATGRQLDKWDVAVPPLHECWNGALGPGDYFAKTLVDVIPAGDTIGLVPCAISGEKIETFLKVGGAKYNWIVQRAKLAQQAGGVIEGMLFHQGESNSGDSSWPGKVNTLVTDLRADLGIGNVPFLAGELPYDGNSAGHNTQVNRLPGVINNAYVVSASGLKVDPADTQWNLHFDRESQVTFGKRYEAKMVEALHW